ncbi:hypothetical protein HYT01_02230 [Candidatus Giovannonibacteria bacterium]|nr:hypothetical protein [Candidatus Giovannonibacteria bacterium]
MQRPFGILKKQVERGVLPHAYLFSGRDEEAKNTALEFLICSAIGADYKREPDFYELASPSISIKEVRELRASAGRSPISAKKNVFLIRNIENLTRDAAPILLKLLEDPSDSSLFIATSQNFNLILSTIRSRFSHLRFWSNSEPKDSEELLKIQKLSYSERFSRAAKLAEDGGLETLVSRALCSFGTKLKKEHSADAIYKTQELLRIKEALRDPTMSKRLLGEYFMMII